MSDIGYHDNINLIQRLDFIYRYGNNWFPDRDATIVIIVIFQTNTPKTSYWLAQLIL